MDIQVHIPPGLAAVHNFIVQLDPYNLNERIEELDSRAGPPDPDHGIPPISGSTLSSGPVTQ